MPIAHKSNPTKPKGDKKLPDTQAAKFFDSFANVFDTFYDERRSPFMRWVDQHFRSDMLIRFVRTFEALGNLTGRTVVDIGCGSGPYVVEALNRGAKLVTAVDPAPQMLTLAKKRLDVAGLADRCALVEGSFPSVKLASHDHAIVMGVMDYVPDPVAFLTALKGLVKESAVLSFPSHHWFRGPLRLFRYRMRHCPLYLYNENQVRGLCESAGFRGINIWKIPGAGMDYHVCLKP
jgi:ubiquinone/menaquinone biosynthesis C-methylase UbiE